MEQEDSRRINNLCCTRMYHCILSGSVRLQSQKLSLVVISGTVCSYRADHSPLYVLELYKMYGALNVRSLQRECEDKIL